MLGGTRLNQSGPRPFHKAEAWQARSRASRSKQGKEGDKAEDLGEWEGEGEDQVRVRGKTENRARERKVTDSTDCQ
jgi:hypothetical protein